MISEDFDFLKVDEFAKRMSITKEQVYEWIKIGKIAALRLNDGPKSPWRIPVTELYRFREMCYDKDSKL